MEIYKVISSRKRKWARKVAQAFEMFAHGPWLARSCCFFEHLLECDVWESAFFFFFFFLMYKGPFWCTHWTVGTNFWDRYIRRCCAVPRPGNQTQVSFLSGWKNALCPSSGRAQGSGDGGQPSPPTMVGKGGTPHGLLRLRFAGLAGHQRGPGSESPEGHQHAVLSGASERFLECRVGSRDWEGHGSSKRC